MPAGHGILHARIQQDEGLGVFVGRRLGLLRQIRAFVIRARAAGDDSRGADRNGGDEFRFHCVCGVVEVSLTKTTLSRSAATLTVRVFVKLGVRPPAGVEEFHRHDVFARRQLQRREADKLRQIVPGADVGLRRGGGGNHFADQPGERDAEPDVLRRAIVAGRRGGEDRRSRPRRPPCPVADLNTALLPST